jgi:hypothetical protein
VAARYPHGPRGLSGAPPPHGPDAVER